MIVLIFCHGVNAASFNDGAKTAGTLKANIEENIKSGSGKSSVPGFKEGFKIDESETSKAFEHANNNEAAKAVKEIHKDRGIYKFDEKDPLIERSESIQKDPEKALNEVDVVENGGESYTIETCEECSEEEYLVRARKTKKRYVYLDKPPYIETTGAKCSHGKLAIRITIPNEPEGAFREDGIFEIVHTGRSINGADTFEHFLVNGTPLTLQKTVYQNGKPWPNRGKECVMTAALHKFVLDSPDLIRTLLGGTEDQIYDWGKIGKAHLHHRVINDTGEHYWIEDDKCQEYERLCEVGLCRYHSMIEDSLTDKYWKGKKVTGSWGQTVTYACKYDCEDTCKKLKFRGCEQIGTECIQVIDGKCVKWKQKYRCRDRIKGKSYKFSGETEFCLDGNCIDSSFKSDEDMVEALGYLSILKHVQNELNGTGDIQIFKGRSYSCTRWLLSFKDCCGRGSGWGVDIGLASCDGDSKEVAKLRQKGVCVRIGTYCAERVPVLGTCIRKKTVFCCFGNKFAKLLQEQGKKQLGSGGATGAGFGTPESPNCRGFTAEELSRIDFSKLDLSEISKDVMESFKPQLDPQKHFAKGDELQKIRESMKELPMVRSMEQKEGAFLKENVKHMTSG
jgi:hypothetical protein